MTGIEITDETMSQIVKVLKRNKRDGEYKPMSMETLAKRIGYSADDSYQIRKEMPGHPNVRWAEMKRDVMPCPCYRTDEESRAFNYKRAMGRDMLRRLKHMVESIDADAEHTRKHGFHCFTISGTKMMFHLDLGISEGLSTKRPQRVAVCPEMHEKSIILGNLVDDDDVQRARDVIVALIAVEKAVARIRTP